MSRSSKLSSGARGGRSEVGVDGGGGDGGVAEQNLHDADIDAILDQSCRVTMLQRMRRHPLPEACGGGSCGKGARQHPIAERRVPVAIGKQPTAIAMGPPQAVQIVEDRPWQRHQPLLVGFADDPQHLAGSVNGADLQRGGLADMQAARINDGEARLVDRVADAAEQLPDLSFRQRFRQPLLPGRANPFSPNSPHARPSVRR
jgi:hypothetical protein